MHHHFIGAWIAVAIGVWTAIAMSLWVVHSARKDGKAEGPETQEDLSPVVRERIPGTRL